MTATVKTTTEPAADLQVPLRPCTSWCEYGDSHPNEHPEDRRCWSTYEIVPLTRHAPLQMGNNSWWRGWLNVYLSRLPEDADSTIYVHSEETDAEVILTLAEARQLRDGLTRLLEQADV